MECKGYSRPGFIQYMIHVRGVGCQLPLNCAGKSRWSVTSARRRPSPPEADRSGIIELLWLIMNSDNPIMPTFVTINPIIVLIHCDFFFPLIHLDIKYPYPRTYLTSSQRVRARAGSDLNTLRPQLNLANAERRTLEDNN